MSWSDRHRLIRTLTRTSAALAMAAFVGGCFQPLYGTHKADGGEAISTKMSGVDVAKIELPNGTRLSRIGVEVRNQVIYNLTGGGPAQTPTHKLEIHLTSTQAQASLQVVSKQLDEFRARGARLVAERDGLARPDLPEELAPRIGEPAIRSLLSAEATLFQARANARESQKALLRNRIGQLNEEIGGHEAQVSSKVKQI